MVIESQVAMSGYSLCRNPLTHHHAHPTLLHLPSHIHMHHHHHSQNYICSLTDGQMTDYLQS